MQQPDQLRFPFAACWLLALSLLLSGCGAREVAAVGQPSADLQPHAAPFTAIALARSTTTATSVPPQPTPSASRTAVPIAPTEPDRPFRYTGTPTIFPTQTATPTNKAFPPEVAQQIIAKRAYAVLLALKTKNMQQLATFVHPRKGVRFSPYSLVGTSDLVFVARQLSTLPGSTTKYSWGVYEGVGYSTDLTFDDYYAQFVYSHDFVQAEQIGYNQIIGRGNMRENSFDFYPQSIVVEYYFSGFNPKYGGMDWESLRLVFQQEDEVWYLVGIIHDGWTI